MYKYSTITILALALFLVACTGKTSSVNDSQTSEQSSDDSVVIITSENKDYLKAYYQLPEIKNWYDELGLTDDKLPDLVVPADLSKLSFEDLRLLRNEIYARNGYLFSDPYLRGYFNRFKWYRPIFGVDSFKVAVNSQEKNLLDKISAREKALKTNAFTEVDGLKLYNTDLIVNTKHYKEIPPQVMQDLKTRNFSVNSSKEHGLIFQVYEQNTYDFIPHYITTDLYAFVLHKFFESQLQIFEEKVLSKQINTILNDCYSKIYTGDKEAAQWARTYLASALYALGDKNLSVDQNYSRIFTEEKNNIDALSGKSILIPNYYSDYQELTPRGNYTRNQTLKNYFKGFKWITINGIDLDNDAQLKGFLAIAQTIKSNKSVLDNFNGYLNKIQKISGTEDNLSMSDLIKIVGSVDAKNLFTPANLSNVRKTLKSLNKERIKTVYSDKNTSKERKITRVNMIAATYSINAEIFTKLVKLDPVNPKRPFPTGLDIPACFGNKTAENILLNQYKEGDSWPEYPSKLKECQNQFKNFNNWNTDFATKALQTDLSACAEQNNYPDFMKTDAYNRKEINTMLSGWTFLKHSLVLYNEKPFGAECGGGGEGPEPPQYFCYVEPNIVFWNTALDLVKWMKDLFKDLDCISCLNDIEKLGVTLKDAAQTELAGKSLSAKTCLDLKYIGGEIERLYMAMLNITEIIGRDASMSIISDTYKCNNIQMFDALGPADEIYVVVPVNGEYHIAKGATFSFYEFRDNKIYTDELWQDIVNKGTNMPDRPAFYKDIARSYKELQSAAEYRFIE